MNFIEEIVWYSRREHAKIVFRKCIKAGKLKLAQKIAYNYDLNETGNDDTVVALGLSIMTSAIK